MVPPPAKSETQAHPWGQAVTWSSRTISVLQQLPWAINRGLCGNNFNCGCSQENQPHPMMPTSRDSPYFSLKSSFTCSRRITFSPSLLASSSSAKARKNRGELNFFPSEPLENQTHRHRKASLSLCPSMAWGHLRGVALCLHPATSFRAVQSSCKMLPDLHLPCAATSESILYLLCGAVND